ncbi:MAG: DoxX family protein [Parcubacteria group bacterium]|nr:DoxX family protein [Parcubacteria group bacterium]
MLTVFPSLLFLSLLAPFILRIVVGVILFSDGFSYFKGNKEKIAGEATKMFGGIGRYSYLLVGGAEALIGLSLIAGYLTQVSALLGAILIIKIFFLKKKMPTLSLQSNTTYILLLAILVSLIVTGAGAFAVDLPL